MPAFRKSTDGANFSKTIKEDLSGLSRHPGESRGPEKLKGLSVNRPFRDRTGF